MDQPDPRGTDRRERGPDVRNAVADVMQPFSAAGEEPADRGIRPRRFEELDIGGRYGRDPGIARREARAPGRGRAGFAAGSRVRSAGGGPQVWARGRVRARTAAC
jgi:hypothetical protein